jgi:predicted secreted protein
MVAGLRARTLAFNAAAVDITDQDSASRWRAWRVIVPDLGTVEGPFQIANSNMAASTTARSPSI